MGNQPGNQPPNFTPGYRLKAEDLNKIVRSNPGRLAGAGDLEVHATRKGTALTNRRGKDGKRPPDTIIIELGSPTSGGETGEYDFTIAEGPGPNTGTAFEIMGREGLPTGLRVIARRAAGKWYFYAADVPVRYGITAIGDNTLSVVLLQNTTVAGTEGLAPVTGAPTLTIWKPWELQRQSWDTFTIDGVTYTYVNSQERTGSDGTTTETQIIIPPYVTGTTTFRSHQIVYAAILAANGGAPTGPLNRMMDMNRAGRAWAKEAA